MVLALSGAGTLAFLLWLVLATSSEGHLDLALAPVAASGVEAPATAPSAGPVASPGPTGDLEREARLEQALAARAESLLALTTGAGRVAVRVRAELDWSQREETREVYDPDGQVERSEERTSEPHAGVRGGPVPGRTSQHVEYDVGKQVTRAVTPAGAVKRLHVAVLVDAKPASGGAVASWSPVELAQLESLAKQAIGFSLERGDELTLTSAPFRVATAFDPLRLALLADGLRFAAILAGLGILAVVALRSLGPRPAVAGLPMSAAELEAALLGGSGLPNSVASERAGSELALADDMARAVGPAADRDAGAAALRAWLNER